jgi:hypothetical protein
MYSEMWKDLLPEGVARLSLELLFTRTPSGFAF